MGPLSLEQRLVAAIKTGELVDLVPGQFSQSENVAKDFVEQECLGNDISAEFIRNLLRGKDIPIDKMDPRGLRLRGARIIGCLDLENLTIQVPLVLTSCQVPDGINAQSAQLPKLVLDNCAVGDSQTNSNHGVICLENATINGELSLAGSTLTAHEFPALNADGLKVDGDVLLNKSFEATASSEEGTISLIGAKISGQLILTGATLRNTKGPALFADSLSVEGGMFLRWPFQADVSSQIGAIRLLCATIGTQLSLSGAKLTNDYKGPALFADMLTVHGNMRLTDHEHRVDDDSGNEHLTRYHFEANATSEDATIRLRCAKISGQLNLVGAKISNPDGPVLDAAGITVASDVYIQERSLPKAYEATKLDGTVILTDAAIGALHVSDDVVNNACKESKKWNIDGLSYSGFPTLKPEIWLKLLEEGTTIYAAQPYQQLAKAARDVGHDREARKVLITQRSDHLRRGEPGLPDKAWGRITNAFVRYGYWSWLPGVWLAAIFLAVLCVVEFWLPTGFATTQDLQDNHLAASCTRPELFQIAVDMTIPLIKTGVNEICQIVPRGPHSTLLYAVSIFAQSASWVLTTFFVAGFTGIIRKN